MISTLSNLSFKRLWKCNFHFLVFGMLGWWALVAGSNPGSMHAVYVLGASCFSLLIVTQVGYFDKLRLMPRKSDVISVFVAVPLAALLQYSLLCLIHPRPLGPNLPFVLVMGWSLVVGALVYSGHYFLHWLFVQRGQRRRVIFDLQPSERAELVDLFHKKGVDEYVEYLSREDLMNPDSSEIDLIVISKGTASNWRENSPLLNAHLSGIPVIDHQQLFNLVSGRIRTADTDPWRFLQNAKPQTPCLRTILTLRSIVEPLFAILLGVLLAPVMLGLAAAIKLTSPGPVLYKQTRTGYLGKIFVLYKFRSMRTDAEAAGPQWSTRNDPRVTPLGRIMRATRLDELPQLWNVLRGDMSFIGPRPERPEIYEQLVKELPLFPLRTLVRPGITGWAQVCSGYAASVAECQLKLEHDLFYIQNISPLLDLIILLKTAQVAIQGDRSARQGVSSVGQAVTSV